MPQTNAVGMAAEHRLAITSEVGIFMKKLFAIFLTAWIIMALSALPCLAMKFSAPVYLGGGGHGMGDGGFTFDNATSNKVGVAKPNRYGSTSDWKGVAKFRSGKEELYYHYGYVSHCCNIGGNDISNTVTHASYPSRIYSVATDSGYVLYVIFTPLVNNFSLIGKRPDGKFVRFIDGNDIKRRYLGEDEKMYLAESFDDKNSPNVQVVDDTFIVPYARGNEYIGEFCFKWDENAQWFGVEQVAY